MVIISNALCGVIRWNSYLKVPGHNELFVTNFFISYIRIGIKPNSKPSFI